MTYRLVLGAVVLFWLAGMVVLLSFYAIRLKTIYNSCRNRSEAVVPVLMRGEAQEAADLAESECIRITLLSDGRTVFRSGTDNIPLFRYAFEQTGTGFDLRIKYETELWMDAAECKGVFVYDVSSEWQSVNNEAVKLIVCYLLFFVFAMAACYYYSQSVLRPIGSISSQVRDLNIQTLHNARLNVEGTEDELKALAGEINEMLDRLDRAYEDQKQFVSEASHELRTPITVLQGYSSMLRRWGAKDPEVLTESVDAIEAEAKSMQDLVEKLLFLSRHERRKLPFHKEQFDLAEIIHELEKEVEYMAKGERKFTLECEPVTVYGDKNALKQAIRVFLDNAVKYTAPGDQISVKCKKVRGACEISIEDTGFGMTEKDLEGIFNRFFRSDTVRGKNIEGHGLGLSIARLIVDGHAGKITVRTQYTKGSCFTITLPRTRGM